MYRRTALRTFGLITVASSAGCTELEEIAAGQTTPNIGESASYEGVQVTPEKYFTTGSFTAETQNASHQTTAPDGATFLFTKLHFSHNGDSAVSFPTDGALGPDSIRVVYDGDKLGDVAPFHPRKAKVDGTTLTMYLAAFQNHAAGDVYPGTEFDAWIGNELAANYSVSNLRLRVVWNDQLGGDEGETTQEWQYTDTGEVSTDNLTGSGDEGDTIVI